MHTDQDQQRVEELLKEFESYSKLQPGDIPWSVSLGQGPHLVVTTLIHGDEVGPLPAVLKCIRELIHRKSEVGCRISFAIGNLEAARKATRFVSQDLNRIFHVEDLGIALSAEEKRAIELKKLISTAEIYLDFHQTIQKSLIPFYVMANHNGSALWAQALSGIEDFVTQPMEESFSPGSKCSDEFAQELNIPALSIECWQKGFDERAEALTASLINQALDFLPQAHSKSSFLASQAKKVKPLQVWSLTHRYHPKSEKAFLDPGFQNFDPVTKGQDLGSDGEGGRIFAECNGVILFPKYARPSEKAVTMRGSLFVIARRMSE